MLYRTRTIRYVPDTARGEFINLGVIAMGEHPDDVAVRTLETIGQIPEIGGPRDIAIREAHRLQRVAERFAGSPTPLEIDASSTPRDYFALQARNAYNLIQYSDEGIAAGDSASAVADFLFQHLVAREQTTSRQRRLPRLRRQLIATYEGRPATAEHLIKHPRLRTGKRTSPIDLAVADERAIELSSAFTFRVQPTIQLRERVDAWSFRMRLLRDGNAPGLLLHGDDRSTVVDTDVPITALVEMPQTALQRELYEEVTEPWGPLGINPIVPDQLDLHARQLEARLPAA